MGKIYKIHGSADDFRSIVLTSEDYKQYRSKNPYLVAKILTLFSENPVLFFGYSFTDKHVQEILSELTHCLDRGQLETLNGRLIFTGRAQGENEDSMETVPYVVNDHEFEICKVKLQSWAPLFRGLANLPYHFAPHVLRKIRESVYLLSSDMQLEDCVKLVGIDDSTNMDDVEVVLGVGLSAKLFDAGYGALTVRDYLKDLLKGEGKFDPRSLVKQTFEYFNPTYIPVYYVERLAEKRDIDLAALHSVPMQKYRNVRGKLSVDSKKLKDISDRSYADARGYELPDYLRWLMPLALEKWKIDDVILLRDDLLAVIESSNDRSVPTAVLKACCLFDRLVYSGQWKSEQQNELYERLGFENFLK